MDSLVFLFKPPHQFIMKLVECPMGEIPQQHNASKIKVSMLSLKQSNLYKTKNNQRLHLK